MNTPDLPTTQLEAIRYFASDENCHNFLTSLRFPHGVTCGYCMSHDVGKLVVSTSASRSKRPDAKPVTRRLWRCKSCSKQFTAKAGTIFEDSALGLDKWLPAVWLICNAKNGVSSCELARALGVTQKTAWFMGHRIRVAMAEGSFMVSGEVEADETFIGGAFGNMHHSARKRRQQLEIDTGILPKVPVHGVLQRSTGAQRSRVALRVLTSTSKEQVIGAVRARVQPGSKVFTDALRGYHRGIKGYDHSFVDKTVEYVSGKVHTNGLENFWSLLKRTLGGTYVNVSPEHLFRYLDEQATRFNERAKDDLGRFMSAMDRVIGRRLTWAELVANGVIRRPGPETE